MARLIPKIDPSEIENPGERRFAKALVEELPKKVWIFHSFNWLGENLGGKLLEGECDFVVLDPDNGMLFIEVKGGSLEFDPQEMEWLRVNSMGQRRVINKNPFDQVRRNMHEIENRVKKNLLPDSQETKFTCGYAVAFPDCNYKGVLPADIVPELVLDMAKCRDLKRSIQTVFDRFRRRYHVLSAEEITAIKEALYPKFSILPVLWRKVEDQEERLKRLTSEQERLLDFLSSHSKAAIRGVAGSGKTILALAKAQGMARNGMKTLFLCYNSPLRDWLREAIPDTFSDNLVIENYHSLVANWCKKAGIDHKPGAKSEKNVFWTDIAPEHLMQACDILGPENKFDAVIVDEGQDFYDLWWTSLDGVFRDPNNKGCYYVFYDPNQNLFVENPSIPRELGDPFELPTNCRNTVRIAEHCADLVNQSNKVKEGAPIGDKPAILEAKSISDGFKQAGKIVKDWCIAIHGGLKQSQIAVLAPGFSEREWPKDFHSLPVTLDFDKWRNNEGVLISSWGRFKGLETDAAVIIETPMADVELENANRYVAHSRAKHLLTVIQVQS